MKIAYGHQIFGLQSYGGISRYFVRLAKGLSALEQQGKVFAPLHKNSYLLELPKNMVSGRHVSYFPPKTARLFFTYNQVQSRLQIAAWKPDLVHETYYSRFRSVSKNCPTVITVYDMIHELFPSEFSSRDNTVSIKRIAINRADHIICISKNTKLDLMRLYGLPDKKISVVHLGFDQFPTAEITAKQVVAAGRPFLLYVGQRSGYKNFNGFLKAVAASKLLITDFDIIAFGGPEFSDPERCLMSTLGFAPNQVIHLSGNDNLLGHHYSLASAFVYPSLYEGFGIPPLEAMAHNCPVISSNTSSMPEVIGAAAEFFNPLEIDDMRRAIESVVYSDKQMELLKKSGSTRLQEFSWAKCSENTLRIYNSLI